MTVKEQICDNLSEDKYITGTELAEILGVTRSYISKAVKELQADGIKIETKLQHGYKLAPNQDILSENAIRKDLKAEKLGSRIILFNEIESTNDYLKELARNGEPHGTIAIANSQTGGKGRRGRNFKSPGNFGLYYSVLIRPHISMELSQLITACAAVATAETIDKICGSDTKIKWVNDIFLGDKKCVGILTEASVSFEEGSLDYAIIGIGINVFQTKGNLPEELYDIATSIEDYTGKKYSRNLIAAELTNSLEKHLNNIATKKFLDVYKSKSNIIGKNVIVTINGEQKKAVATGIDDKASLIVKFANGEEVHLNSGEARVLPDKVST